MDTVSLIGIRLWGHHGLLAWEQTKGQCFEVDVLLSYDTRTAAQSDDLAHTVNYVEVYHALHALFAGQKVHLLETLAHRAVQLILQQFPLVEETTLRIRKPSPELGGFVAYSSVEITRNRTDIEYGYQSSR